METKKLYIRATDKVAFIRSQDPTITVDFTQQTDGQTVYMIDDTRQVRALLARFQSDAKVPCKTYSDLIKSLRCQLMAAKKVFEGCTAK